MSFTSHFSFRQSPFTIHSVEINHICSSVQENIFNVNWQVIELCVAYFNCLMLYVFELIVFHRQIQSAENPSQIINVFGNFIFNVLWQRFPTYLL